MGVAYSIFGRFRKKASTKENLELIEEDIKNLKLSLKRNNLLKTKCVWFLLLISLILYTLSGIIFYIWYMPSTWFQRLCYFIPFLMFPVLVFFLKKLLHYIFVSRISKTSQHLEERKKEKQKILENVMETETYKVAKELLQKYDPNRKLVEKEDNIKTPVEKTPHGGELHKRHIVQTPHPSNLNPRFQSTPMLNGNPRMVGVRPPGMQPTPNFPTPMTPRVITPRIPNAPILPRDRTFVDKIADFFVGDGPSNRYALICSRCFSHNGMALAEEFEYVAFKCCYCGHFNPARKKRLIAPKENIPIKQNLDSDNRLEKSDTESQIDTVEELQDPVHSDGDSTTSDKENQLDKNNEKVESEKEDESMSNETTSELENKIEDKKIL